MTDLLVTFDYDADDQVQRTARSEVFFAAWLNQFGLVEWTCSDEALFAEYVTFAETTEI